MKREDILKEADWHYENICLYNEDGHPEIYKDGFVDGADWRINSVWHDKHDEPALNKFYLWIDEFGIYSLDINHRNVASWASYVDVQRIVKWAYVNDLKPSKTCEYLGVCKYGEGADSPELYDCDAERIANAYETGWDETLKEPQVKIERSVIIELDTVIEYKGGQVYIKKMNTNEMPAILTFGIIEALNNTIVEYHKKDKK